jgi:tRNA-modifying protein YgfZ
MTASDSRSVPPVTTVDTHALQEAIGDGLVGMKLSQHHDRIEILGEDRAKFLHNLCTADVNKLSSGTGTEAFFLNAKGKTIDYGRLYATQTSIWLDLEPERASVMLKHLDRYLFRERVNLHDRTAAYEHLHLLGPKADEWIRSLNDVPTDFPVPSVAEITTPAGKVQIRRMARSVWPGWDILVPQDSLASWIERFDSMAGLWLDNSVIESLRVEAGIPRFGKEITEENLAQEIGRDALAISFAKGCYIGQETVARLDAMGHVNKLLRGIELPANASVQVGAEIRAGENLIGRVASVADALKETPSKRALAVLRLNGGSPGDRVTIVTDQGVCEGSVVTLPFPST